ncbi:MAG: SUMF1/EgtB/PvdO family nonheme iron enzyme [Gammaproteobacteria bacterium]|nr:SUMF1/EgtB/PvdO family nonheme iron enzyme [Gammaproteobacteria bacterium]
MATSTSLVVAANKDANYYLREASKAYNKEDYPQAEKHFRKLLQMKVPMRGDFYYYYGKTLYFNGDYEKAADNLSAFTETVGKKSKYYSEASRLLMRSKKKIAKQNPESKQEKKQKTKQEQQSKQKKQSQASKNKAVGNKHSYIPEMITIPTGSFIMGSNHGSPDQKPPHRIKIKKSFAMGKYEVTFAQYDVFAKATKRKKPDDHGWGRGNRPVINVSLQNAHDYANWLSKKTKRRFRLPTEVEWEYVARTGFKSQLGFNDLVGLGDANCDGCRYFWESAKTVDVGSFDANKYEIHDLFGNVWEWTCSFYTKRYNGLEKKCADKHDLEGKTIAVRGGGWNSFSEMLRSYVRFNNFPTYRNNDLGFRLVEELD